MKNDQGSKNFSISAFANACGTTKDTLYHYENQGVLVPNTDEKNHYRYYSPEDFHRFQFIAHLRRMGFSLSEIRECLKKRNVASYVDILSLCQDKAKEEIYNAERQFDIASKAKEAVTKFSNISFETPKVEYSDVEYFRCDEFCGEFDSLDGLSQIENHLATAFNMSDTTSNIAVFKISNESLNGSTPQHLEIMVQTSEPENVNPDNLHKKEAGLYLHMLFNLDLMTSTNKDRERCYKKMINYALEHNYTIISDLYCYDHIGRFLTDKKNEFLSEFVFGII